MEAPLLLKSDAAQLLARASFQQPDIEEAQMEALVAVRIPAIEVAQPSARARLESLMASSACTVQDPSLRELFSGLRQYRCRGAQLA